MLSKKLNLMMKMGALNDNKIKVKICDIIIVLQV